MAGRAENGGWRIPTIGRAAEAVEQLSDTDESDSDDATQSDEPNWVSWFCSLRGNEFFCEVRQTLLRSRFGLGSGVTNTFVCSPVVTF